MADILVAAAHPDDEVLGCGGIIARHASQGDRVQIVFMTDGVAARGQDQSAESDRRARRDAACAAAELLGAAMPVFLGFPDNRMDSVHLLDVVQALEAIIAAAPPKTVYTHHFGDLNIDHQVTHRAVLTACRPQPGNSVEAIYTFEVPSATDYAGPGSPFVPRRFVDISSSWQKKRAALEVYETEMRPYPHARSLDALEALAKLRGTSVGFGMAEGLDVIRERVSD